MDVKGGLGATSGPDVFYCTTPALSGRASENHVRTNKEKLASRSEFESGTSKTRVRTLTTQTRPLVIHDFTNHGNQS